MVALPIVLGISIGVLLLIYFGGKSDPKDQVKIKSSKQDKKAETKSKEAEDRVFKYIE
jgi:hypothetical protein